MDDSAFIEKRAFRRFAIGIPLSCQVEREKILSACTHDISAGGLGIITAEELPSGTTVAVRLSIPDDGQEMYRKARVVWSSCVDAQNYRAGLQLETADLKPIPIVLKTIKAQRQY